MRGNIDFKGVITSLGPSEKRAQLAKGVLQELGLPNVPVAIGSAADKSMTVLAVGPMTDLNRLKLA